MPTLIQSQLSLYTNALGQEQFIPILRYNSNKVGRKILLTCLNHGNEIIGAMSALQVFNQAKTDPNFTGEIIVMSCLNQAGMERNSRFFEADNLYDTHTQNLNRNFGTNGTSLTSMVANIILEFIVAEQPDLVIDCHSYSANSLVHIILDCPGGEQETNLIKLAQKSKIPFYLEYEATTLAEQKLDYCLSNQLLLRGILAITIELGPQYGFDNQQLQTANQALSNLVLNTNYDLYQSQNAQDMQQNIGHRQPVINQSQHCGILHYSTKLGQIISKDTEIAKIYDLFGNVVHRVLMPQDGIILVWSNSNYTYPKSQLAVIVV